MSLEEYKLDDLSISDITLVEGFEIRKSQIDQRLHCFKIDQEGKLLI